MVPFMYLIQLSASMRRFQPKFLGDSTAFRLAGITCTPDLFHLSYQCSYGVSQGITADITGEDFPCILSIFCPNTDTLVLSTACFFSGRRDSEYVTPRFFPFLIEQPLLSPCILLSSMRREEIRNINRIQKKLVIEVLLSIYIRFST